MLEDYAGIVQINAANKPPHAHNSPFSPENLMLHSPLNRILYEGSHISPLRGRFSVINQDQSEWLAP